MIKGYRHTGLVVRDLERSLAFYQTVLGFTLLQRTVEQGPFIEAVVGLPSVKLEWAKLTAPDQSVLELLQYHSHPQQGEPLAPPAANQLGCSHVAWTVTDLDACYHKLLALQVWCNSPPQGSPDGAVKVLYCHDPDGIILELVEERQ